MENSAVDVNRPRFELREVWSDGTEKAQVCSLQDLANQVSQISMDRRGFLGLSAFTTAALLAACSPSPTPTAVPSPAPTPTPEIVDAKTQCVGLQAHQGFVNSVAIGPKGDMLASGGVDKLIKLWRVSDGSLLRKLEGHTDFVNSVAFSPDGTLLASGSNDKTVRLWRVSDGSVVRELLSFQ